MRFASIATNQPAINTLWKIFDLGSPNIANTIANVGDIAGPTFSATIVDVTSHSTGTPWRQKCVTLLDNGDVTLPLYFIPSSPGSDNQPSTQFGHNFTSGLGSVFAGRQLRNYAMVFPDAGATTYYMQAYISKYSFDAKVAGVLGSSCTFSCTTQPILV